MNAKELTPEELSRLKMKPADIGKLLTARRAACGLSERQVARHLNVSQATVSRWERGYITATTVKMLNFLLGGEDSINEMWRRRALIAEATIKDILVATREYREGQEYLRAETVYRAGGPQRDNGAANRHSRAVGEVLQGSS